MSLWTDIRDGAKKLAPVIGLGAAAAGAYDWSGTNGGGFSTDNYSTNASSLFGGGETSGYSAADDAAWNSNYFGGENLDSVKTGGTTPWSMPDISQGQAALGQGVLGLAGGYMASNAAAAAADKAYGRADATTAAALKAEAEDHRKWDNAFASAEAAKKKKAEVAAAVPGSLAASAVS